WVNPNPAYDGAVQEFVSRILDEHAGGPFLEDFRPFQRRIGHYGLLNGLAQTLVKLTAPGVPDTYQGTELWDLSLVDPDNRRPVDYDERAKALAGVADATASELWSDRSTGRPKLALLHACLQLRRCHPAAFGRHGTYEPLAVTGASADRVIGFVRGGSVAVVVPRLVRAGSPYDAVVALPD